MTTRTRLTVFLPLWLTLSSVGGCLFGSDNPDTPDMGSKAGEICDTPGDDDGDGLINCADPECALQACSRVEDAAVCDAVARNCVGGERGAECSDSLDNDRDGEADCMDPDCASVCACADGSCLELCGDNIDNDGDGTVNEGCPCRLRGSSNGLCGVAFIGVDGTCTPPAGLQVEETLCDNIDNDCDGAVDEGCPCVFQNRGFGVCLSARFDERNQCKSPDTFRAAEVARPGDFSACDGLDNDCDGATDEVGCEGSSCNYLGSSRGACASGVVDGAGGCRQPRSYQPEEVDCDGTDNDCDGAVDEGCPCVFQGRSLGVCLNARVDPAMSLCAVPQNYQSEETACDGADNDCDGVVDEGCGARCLFRSVEVGVCIAGAAVQGGCQAPKTYVDEEHGGGWCDGLDNDCDGIIDEGCACAFGARGVGVCALGVLDDSGACSEPEEFQASSEKQCNDGLDNNCNGATDCADPECALSEACRL